MVGADSQLDPHRFCRPHPGPTGRQHQGSMITPGDIYLDTRRERHLASGLGQSTLPGSTADGQVARPSGHPVDVHPGGQSDQSDHPRPLRRRGATPFAGPELPVLPAEHHALVALFLLVGMGVSALARTSASSLVLLVTAWTVLI